MSDENNANVKFDIFRIPSTMNLIAFERAAKYSSFAKAAQDIGRSPSAVSRAVRELEERLDVALFERIGKSVQLTNAGKKYLAEVRAALNILDLGGKSVKAESGKNTVRLKVPPLFAQTILIPGLEHFRKRFPDLELIIETSRDSVDWSNGDADVEIRLGKATDSWLFCKPIGSIYLVPICSPKLMEGPDGIKEIPDLQRFTLIHDVQRPNDWRDWLDAAGFPHMQIKNKLVVGDVKVIFESARHGLGVTFAAYPFLFKYPCYDRDIVMPFGDTTLNELSYYFVCRSDKKHSRNIVLFMEWLQETYKKIFEQVNNRHLSQVV